MMWLTWRQFRGQAIAGAAALAAFALLLGITGPHMADLYHASGITSCRGDDCAGVASRFLVRLTSGGGVPLLPAGSSAYVILYFLSVLVILAAPAFIGIFWGAPLIARELETGTCQLAWNQSITRTRWLTVKLTLTGLVAMAVTETFSLVQAWWAAPIGEAVGHGGSASILTEGRLGSFVFPTHGITPIGYAAFGFALAVTMGLLFRRAIPAMAVTLAIFAIVQLAVPLWIRPHLIPPDQTIASTAATQTSLVSYDRGVATLTAGAVPGHPGAWILSSQAVSAAGRPVNTMPAACQPSITPATDSGSEGALQSCLDSHGITESVTYQPASRYWPLQLAETGLFLVLALALAGYCFRRLSRSLSLPLEAQCAQQVAACHGDLLRPQAHDDVIRAFRRADPYARADWLRGLDLAPADDDRPGQQEVSHLAERHHLVVHDDVLTAPAPQLVPRAHVFHRRTPSPPSLRGGYMPWSACGYARASRGVVPVRSIRIRAHRQAACQAFGHDRIVPDKEERRGLAVRPAGRAEPRRNGVVRADAHDNKSSSWPSLLLRRVSGPRRRARRSRGLRPRRGAGRCPPR
ncbi:MAG TPA: hypothetical protein VKU39_04910 [Streptosporangiaceae bacterium]|nr:hypothetical protein [Streptosporangiaceae bacterium]